ncbi:MAG: hypothetical protein RMX96_30180 [Nostoc sp. ChiSLP02]|nr:hypothetical protein [Nostoc sp. DedSLP05]MDZ8100478.1 hypothetical protein [Nostoc sp. DedSLP01]MDZ8189098.1 hypothetical protein [Nostoc sp. ChiSLP02]
MLQLGWYSAKLFLKGKLLRDPIYFFQQTAIASAVGSLLLVLFAQTELPFCLPITISSLATGIITPFLLKDFKTK